MFQLLRNLWQPRQAAARVATDGLSAPKPAARPEPVSEKPPLAPGELDTSSWFNDLDMRRLGVLKKMGFTPHSVFDVGASDAWWSRLTAVLFPEAEFHLFEPLSDLRADYHEKQQEALQAHPRFHLHNLLLGDRNGPATMRVTPDGYSSTILEMDSYARFASRPVQFEMRTLDSCIVELGLPVPQIVKIDAQGAELSILKGLRNFLCQVDVLLLEVWLVRGYGQQTPLFLDVCRWLAQYGLHLWDFADCCRDGDGVNVSQDCIFLNERNPLSCIHGYNGPGVVN